MFSSRLKIDVDIAPGRLWLRNLYHVHQRLCMAFPSASRKSDDPDFLQPFKPEDFGASQVYVARKEDSGFLFRIDPRPPGRVVILVQSAIKPNWDYAFHNAGYLLACPSEVKEFEPDFQAGQSLRFRLAANPTRKIDTKTGPDGRKNNGQRVPVPAEKLEEWLTRRAVESGFRVQQFLGVQAGYLYFKKGEGEGNRLRSARYDGILEVTGPAQFRDALAHGIGPGKAFGFGLLSVAQLRGERREVGGET